MTAVIWAWRPSEEMDAAQGMAIVTDESADGWSILTIDALSY
jgi:hypothetical protein